MAELSLPVPALGDAVVSLRPWRETDVPAKLMAFGDPVVQRFSWSRTAPYTEAGGGSLYDVDLEQSRAAVGYWLAPAARGRGVATHAVRLLARWAFSGLGLARLELTCGPDNEASQRVAARCGFVREGVLRSHIAFKGDRRDTVVFSVLPHELK